jgi:hypothetical protein
MSCCECFIDMVVVDAVRCRILEIESEDSNRRSRVGAIPAMPPPINILPALRVSIELLSTS